MSSLGRLTHALDRPYLRLAVLSAAAAAAAYGLGVELPHVSPVVAAITALITVQPTFHASMKEALRQVLGVILGASLAFAAIAFVGYSAFALFATIVVCFGVARVLRLGEEGAAAVAVTVILVVGPHFSTDATEARLFGVLLGSALALVTSFFTRPGTPEGRALGDLVSESDRAAALMATIAESLPGRDGRVPWWIVRRWLAEAEEILQHVVATRQAAEDAAASARWSPMIDRQRAEAVLRQARIAERTAVTLVSMCRDLVVAAERNEPLHDGLATSLSDVLLATADAIGQQSQQARNHPAEPLAELTGPIRVARRARTDAAVHVRHLDDTGRCCWADPCSGTPRRSPKPSPDTDAQAPDRLEVNAGRPRGDLVTRLPRLARCLDDKGRRLERSQAVNGDAEVLDLGDFQVIDDSDDDPILLRRDGTPVDTWREGYPYDERLDRHVYDREKRLLQIELLKLQEWIKDSGERLVILFEGRDAAGKGGTIKRFLEHLNPRGSRVVALDKPSERESKQWYFQRYVEHLPAAGEIVLFDRSWYNRAGVERVMGFCDERQYTEFLRDVPHLERDVGAVRSASREALVLRLAKRAADPLPHPPDRPRTPVEALADRPRLSRSVGGLHRGEGSDVLLHRHTRRSVDGHQEQ